MPFNFGSLTSGLGKAASSLASGASRAATGLASAARSPAAANLFSAAKNVGGALLPAFAPQIGQALGNKIGGNAGQMISQMGQAFGAPQEQQGPPMTAQDYINQGQQMGQGAIQQGQDMAANAMNAMLNRYVPQQFQGMNAGNAGNMLGGMTTNFLSRYLPQGMEGQPGLADILGGMAGGYINQGVQRYVPQQFQDINIGDMGNYAAQQGANMANQGLDYATQLAGQQANKLGFAHGGPVNGGYIGGLRAMPRLSLRDISEMMPV